MASSSGSGENHLQQLMDQRKRKRMESNRQSAKRSRIRRRKHLDDLTAGVARLAEENNRILAAVRFARERFAAVEVENSVLRARMTELAQRLVWLEGVSDYVNSAGGCMFEAAEVTHQGFGGGSWGGAWPIPAYADAFDYCRFA